MGVGGRAQVRHVLWCGERYPCVHRTCKEDVCAAGRRVQPIQIDITRGTHRNPRIGRISRVVRDIRWAKETGASIVGASEKNGVVKGRGIDLLPSYVNTAICSDSDLWITGVIHTVREIHYGRERCALVSRTAK